MSNSLRDAIAGRVGTWTWRPGLGPESVAHELATSVDPAPLMYAGHPRHAASVEVDGLAWSPWFVWDDAEELLLIEVLEPPDAPTASGALEAFGEPDARFDRRTGPHPGQEQLAYLTRGFTLFAWGEERTAALWLYRPMELEAYVTELGAEATPTRARRVGGDDGA